MYQIKKMGAIHEELLALMVLYPTEPRAFFAETLGRTKQWVSLVTNSDAFQARYAQLRQQVQLSAITTVNERLVAARSMAIDELMDKLENAEVTASFALEVITKLGKELDAAPGNKGSNTNVYANQAIVMTQEDLAQMRSIITNPEVNIDEETVLPASQVQGG